MEHEVTMFFRNYDIFNLKYNLNDKFKPTDEVINIDIKFNALSSFKGNILYYVIRASLFNDAKNKNYPFELSFDIRGIFEIHEENKEIIENFKKYNCPAILFPYIRTTISTTTGLVNHNPLIIPTYNIIAMLNDNNTFHYENHEKFKEDLFSK